MLWRKKMLEIAGGKRSFLKISLTGTPPKLVGSGYLQISK